MTGRHRCGSFSLSVYLKVTLPALFFIMWFVGLYERARKRSTDRESFDNLYTGLQSLTERKGLEDADKMPLLRILQKLDFLLPRGWEGELHMLRKIRNQLAHASQQELDRIEQPDVVLNTYAMAISALNEQSDA
jgi:hypothetical protein